MTGKDIRLGKLFSNGSPVIIAADHGSYMGPFSGIEDLRRQIMSFSKADALLVMPGMAKQCKEIFSRKDSPLCIIRLNWASHYCKPHIGLYNKGYNEKLNDVQYALSLGADIVIISLLFGTDEAANTRNITQFGEIVAEADRLGVPVIGEYIPAGGLDRYNGELEGLLLGTRACAEFGADLIKTVYVEEYEKVASFSVIPTLALGGGETERPAEAYEIAAKAMKKGAKGIVFGRNVLCAKDPSSYLDCLIEVVKNGVSPLEAEKQYLSCLK